MLISFRLLSVSIAALLLCGAASCGSPQVNTKKSNTRLELAKDFLARQDLPQARREAMKALSYNAENAEAYTILGLVDFLKALNNYRLLELDDCLTGVDAEGMRQEMDASWTSADKSFGKAIALDPAYSEARNNQAKVAEFLGDYDRSIRLYEEALKVPHRLINLGLTRANLGWTRFKAGDMVGAAKDLRQALQFSDGMCVAKYRLGRVYFEREEWNNAVEQFQAVVGSKDCGIQEAHLYLIRTMKQLSTTDDAQAFDFPEAVNRCVALAPKSCVAAQCQIAP
jgi:tetratricopeptide (TPR) repeat protein